jgi:hypothetical protein
MRPRPFDATVKLLVYIYCLDLPTVDSETLHRIWLKHPMLKDYERPSARTIQRWRQEFKAQPRKPKKEWIKI